MILANHLALWWRKDGEGYGSADDLRFVTGRYRAGGPWTTVRNVYQIPERTGIAFRFKGDWHFIGHMRLKRQAESRISEPQEP